tara:strand:- start:1307 stop:2344 length:1038 start_codon:yes stop_codon:yes gene_type:complete
MSFHTRANGGSPTERLRIDSEGRLLLGSTSARLAVGATGDPFLQVEGLAADTAHISIIRNSASAAGPYFSFVKTRGTSDGDVTIVQDGDDIGSILFCPADGVDVNQQSAFIRGEIDGTPGSNDTPGRIVFATTADGSGTPTERLRIDSSGRLLLGTTTEGQAEADDLTIATSGITGITLRSGTSSNGNIFFSDGTSGADEYRGIISYSHSSNSLNFSANAVTTLTLDSSQNATFAGSVSDSKGNLRSIPSVAKSSAHTISAANAGRAIYISTGGVTVDNSVMSAGDAVTIINNSGSDQTITQGSGVTLYNTADASTGNRTLAGRGMATIWFASASVGYISGAGLS